MRTTRRAKRTRGAPRRRVPTLAVALALGLGLAIPATAQVTTETVEGTPTTTAAIPQGVPTEIQDRGGMNDAQEAAARPGNQVLDPKFTGFFPVPNTPVIIKLNPKPHVDVTFDNRNTGDRFRFVPAKFPIEGTPEHGGGTQSFVNANASQIRLDIRAPSLEGGLRFYYQNDFFGSDTSDMRYRLQHLYGQFYGVIAGFTYGVFEDPDAWPDTVDYEGPVATVFARRSVVQYKTALGRNWNATFGLEKPDIFLDNSFDPTAQLTTKIPDIGANVRWEGNGSHVQFSGIVRSVGAKGVVVGKQDKGAWGFNFGSSFKLGDTNNAIVYVNYGDGIGGMGNDTSFINSDAAFNSAGTLETLKYFSGLGAFTHNWSPTWRSTVTYGYAKLDNTTGQPDTAYHKTQYASANIIWQLRKRLSIGAEGLWGDKHIKTGDKGDAWRLQFGLVYSVFD